MSRTLEGVGATPRSGVGQVVRHRPADDLDLGEPPAPESVDADAQRARFEAASEEARAALADERARVADRIGEDEAAVFDAHVQFLDDPQVADGVAERIDEGLPAEHAVERTFAEHVERFEAAGGRTAERADDLRDVRDRLLGRLTGAEGTDLAALPEGRVVVAERLTPSDTARLDPDSVAGFATRTGGRTSHAAIFARSLAIPAVVGVGDALDALEEGETVVVDGRAGELVVDPDEDRRAAAAESEGADVRPDPVSTADGRPIEVAANVGRPAELEGASEQGADGVGLLRTEFLFLDRQGPPDEDEQYETYREALDTFPDGRVVVRTLDVGGDKPIPYLDQSDEENPFLGQRGVRRSLGPDAGLFETQLRALLRAAADGAGELAVMVPMVATVEEFEAARDRVERVAADLAEEGADHARPELGLMIETPAAVRLAPELAERAEFLSIGTNDLTQYVAAAARGNEAVADLHDPRHPAVLRAIAAVVDAAEGTDAWVGMCGEMAGDPDLTALLVGLGLDELSMSSVTVPEVKARVEAIRTAAANDLAERACDASTTGAVAAVLEDQGEMTEPDPDQ
jgi:phosphotransferase system enzyme I (PtsI)